MPYSDSEKRRQNARRYKARNREKMNAAGRAYYARNRVEIAARYRERYHATVRRSWLRRKYGITPVDYDSILAQQNNSCAVCKMAFSGTPRPSVDHCHVTGKVRGILCNECNLVLGLFKDSPRRFEAARDYLMGAS